MGTTLRKVVPIFYADDEETCKKRQVKDYILNNHTNTFVRKHRSCITRTFLLTTLTHDATSLLVAPTEDTDLICDLIHLTQGHSLHCFIQWVEICLDFIIVHGVGFATGNV